MEGWSVEEEEVLNKLTNQKITMGDTALAPHQCLIERQMGNIIKNMSKEKEKRDDLNQKLEKLEEADDPPKNSHVMRNLPPSHILVKQDNLEDPEGIKDSNILQAAM